MTVAELAEFLVENEISGVPVEDAEGRLVGVVSLSDVARSLTGRDEAVLTHTDSDYYLRSWEERFNAEDIAGLRVAESDETVGEIMTPSVLAVDEEMPIGEVAAKMIDARIHRLLVTRDREGRRHPLDHRSPGTCSSTSKRTEAAFGKASGCARSRRHSPQGKASIEVKAGEAVPRMLSKVRKAPLALSVTRRWYSTSVVAAA